MESVSRKGRLRNIYTGGTEMGNDVKKQMSYANAKGISFVAIAGENEIAEGKFTLKNMITGEQNLVTPDELVETLKSSKL